MARAPSHGGSVDCGGALLGDPVAFRAKPVWAPSLWWGLLAGVTAGGLRELAKECAIAKIRRPGPRASMRR